MNKLVYNFDKTGCTAVEVTYNGYNKKVTKIIAGYSFKGVDKLNIDYIERFIETSIDFSFEDIKDITDEYALSICIENKSKEHFHRYKECLNNEFNIDIKNINFILVIGITHEKATKRNIAILRDYIMDILNSLKNVIRSK